MITERQRNILDLIERNKYISGRDIGVELGVSDKTVRNDIRCMREKLSDVFEIKASKKLGYSINIINPYQYKKMFSENNSNNNDYQNRILELLANSTMLGKFITQQEISDILYISLGTTKNYMSLVRNTLNEFGIVLSSKMNRGLVIEGNEDAIRTFLIEYLPSDYIVQKFRLSKWYDTLRKKLLVQIILDDEMVVKLLKAVFISINRNSNLDINPYSIELQKYIKESNEYRIINEVIKSVELKIDEFDILFISKQLMMARKIEPSKTNKIDEIDMIIEKIIQKISNELDVNFSRDKHLKKWLKLHFKSMFPRIRFNQKIKNQLLPRIKKEYPLAFQMAILANKVLNETTSYNMNEDEIGYVAIHFSAAITRTEKKNCDRLRAVIVCSTGIGTALLLKEKLIKEFDEYLNIEDVVPVSGIDELGDEIDFIFTTVPVINKKLEDRIIWIKDIISNEGFKNIKDKLFYQQLNIEKFFRKKIFSFWMEKISIQY